MKIPVLLALTSVLLAGSANAAIYAGTMLGATENPSVASSAMGFTTLTVDGNSMTVNVSWSGLIGGPASMAHVHCCIAPGNNTNVAVGYGGFPAATSGTYSATFNLLDATIYTTAFLNGLGGGTALGARNALVLGLDNGQAYSNIHNAQFPGGEIRANLTAVPEPSSMLCMGAGLLGLLGYVRRRNNSR